MEQGKSMIVAKCFSPRGLVNKGKVTSVRVYNAFMAGACISVSAKKRGEGYNPPPVNLALIHDIEQSVLCGNRNESPSKPIPSWPGDGGRLEFPAHLLRVGLPEWPGAAEP